MATTVTEVPVDRSRSDKLGRDAQRAFHIMFDTASEGNAVSARLAAGVPRIGSPHPNDLYLWASNVDVLPVGDTRILYRADVQYASARGGEGQNSNPITRPPIINWDWEVVSEPIDRDPTGAAVVNVNGEQYDPPLTVEFADAKVVIERNYESFDPLVLQTYRYVVNSDTFLGFPAGTALLKPIRARSQTEGQFLYWIITAEIVFRVDPDGVYTRSWHRRVLQRGFKVRPSSGLPPVWYTDTDGVRTPTPVLLKSDGTAAASVGQAYWKYHPVYPVLPFAGLNLL